MPDPNIIRGGHGALHVITGGSNASGIPRTTSATLQVVGHDQATGVRQSLNVAQFVGQDVSSGLRQSLSVAQFVTQSISSGARGAYGTAQVIRQGVGGAGMHAAFNTLQAVFVTGVPDRRRDRAWFFDFDGHVFYVLDLGAAGALVYDVATEQWSKFETRGYVGHWNFKNGHMWRASRTVVGGSVVDGSLQEIDPTTHLDEGWRPVDYEVRGVLRTGGIDRHRQYALRLVGATGQPADDIAPVLRMQFSDDQGVTWSPEHKVALKSDTRQRIEFRSLGAFTAPGRIFRLYDEGGIKFLAFVEADVGGADSGNAPS